LSSAWVELRRGDRADASVEDLDAGQPLTLEALAAAWDTKACSVWPACAGRG
jgi:hypothetical protein